MITIHQNLAHSLARLSRNNLFRGAFVVAASLVLSSALSAQTPPATDTQAPASTDNQNGGRGNRGNRGNFSPEEMRTRQIDALKEQLGVTSDDEWNLISARATAVMDLRQAAGGGRGGMMNFRGMAGGQGGNNNQNGQGGRGNRQGRMGGANNPELDALQAAITDKAPDAEVKARLERLREVRKDNEAKLTKAQEDLRAVLSVRQEAVAVVYGLLP
jgi:hypothetical protein